MCARKSGDKRKAAKEFPTAAIIKKSAAEIETHIESGSMGRMRDLGLRRLRIQLGYKLLAPNNRVMNGFAFLGSGTFFLFHFYFEQHTAIKNAANLQLCIWYLFLLKHFLDFFFVVFCGF